MISEKLQNYIKDFYTGKRFILPIKVDFFNTLWDENFDAVKKYLEEKDDIKKKEYADDISYLNSVISDIDFEQKRTKFYKIMGFKKE